MSFDTPLALAGALVGFLVGLTGMGGGALLTPLLVLVFGIPPLTAVSSDLVTSLVMKPFAGAVHLRRGTVHLRLFGWLAVGAIPSAFLAAAAVGHLARVVGRESLAGGLKTVIALALIVSLAATIARPWLDRARRARALGPADDPEQAHRSGSAPAAGSEATMGRGAGIRVVPARTVAIGVIGGIAVGFTSVGSGSLVIAMLLLAYPTLRPRELVGTDIVQAIPLVGAAAVGHLLFGDVQFALTGSLLVGAIPGALLGARVSSGAPDALVRPMMAAVLAASALALLGAPTVLILGGAACTALAVTASARTPGLAPPVPAPTPVG